MLTGTVTVQYDGQAHDAKVDMRLLARLEESGLSFIKTCRLVNSVRESGDYESFPFARVSMTIGALLRSAGVKVDDDAVMADMMGEMGVVNAIGVINEMAMIAFPAREPAKKNAAEVTATQSP